MKHDNKQGKPKFSRLNMFQFKFSTTSFTRIVLGLSQAIQVEKPASVRPSYSTALRAGNI